MAASTQRARTVTRPLHLRRPLQPPNPFVKAVVSIAEKLLEKVLTYFCGFRYERALKMFPYR